MPATKEKKDSLGKLKSFGLTELWQVALMLPNGWDDLTTVVDQFTELAVGNYYVLKGHSTGALQHNFGGGVPRSTGAIKDSAGRRIKFTIFGDSRTFEADLKSSPDGIIYLYGQIDTFNGEYQLKSPEIVGERWTGKLRPRYAGKAAVINPGTVRDRVSGLLRGSIPIAADHLKELLAEWGGEAELCRMAGLPDIPLAKIIEQAHIPSSVEEGQRAQRGLERLASFGIIKAAKGNQGQTIVSRRLWLGDWRERAASISFKLTDEQEQAIQDMINDLSSDRPMRRVLSGDVGTGKTAVYLTVAASVVDGFGNVVILMPNTALASQVAAECAEWWPDMPFQLVTGETCDVIHAPLVIGTTAVLFRDVWQPDLVIVDEQQKTSREQREKLVGPETHLLEATATCIPRSQALIRYGVVKVSRLTKNHTKKTIITRIWQGAEGKQLFADAKTTLAEGGQVLMVYPLREKGEDDEDADTEKNNKKPELKSAQEIYDKWCGLYPGKVRLLHGQMSDDEKKAALDAMRSGESSILVSTTVVEVGITIPNLKRVIVVHPDRHGLTTLHQLRGRVARLGGVGYCDLYLSNRVKEATMERLKVLEKTTDGFKVAEYDMKLRGVGDLSKNSNKQSGADETFLYGRPVSIEALDEAMRVLEKLSE